MFPIAVLSLVLLPLAACDSNGGGDGDDGPLGRNETGVELEVSGDITGTYSGDASFSIVQGEGSSMSMTLDDQRGSLTVVRVGDPFATGEFPLSEDDSVGHRFVVLVTLRPTEGEHAGSQLHFNLTSGTVNVTTATNERFAGTISGTGTASGTDVTINITASFAAGCFLLCG